MNYINWILVPIDFSPDSRAALGVADYQAEWWDGGIILLHIETMDLKGTLNSQGEKDLLESWSKYIKRTPHDRVAFIKCGGDPSEKIASVANDYSVRAVFMGKGGKGEKPGHIASNVIKKFAGRVELFSAASTPTRTLAAVT